MINWLLQRNLTVKGKGLLVKASFDYAENCLFVSKEGSGTTEKLLFDFWKN